MQPGQRNAADSGQVRHASRREKDRRKGELRDLRAVLETEPGRRFVYRLLEKAGVFRSVMSTDAIVMAHLSGQQDFGHFLMAEIEAADQSKLFQMMQEQTLTVAADMREQGAVTQQGDEQ